jgi:hypothetical protein
MQQRVPCAKKMTPVLAATAAMVLGLGLFTGSDTARAAPGFVARVGSQASIVEPVRIYRRGRTPIYPYYYNPGRRGGYSFYFGFVPYAPGNIENQAIQRGQYPQNIEWPPGLYGGPRPGWGPKAWD